MPGLIIHLHLYQYVAWEKLAFATTLLAFLHLDHFLGRDQDLAEFLLQTHALDTFLERRFHLVFEIRIGVNYVPA